VYDSARYALLNRWDPSHLAAVRRYLDLASGDRVLEVGAGRGHLVKRLHEAGIDAIGIDLNPQAAEHAVTDRVMQMDATALDFEDGSFDALISVHAIEHIPALDDALAEMCRVVRPGGHLLLIYPAEPIKGLYAIPTSVILHSTPLKARQVHCHQLTPRRLARRLAGLPVEVVEDRFSLFRSPQFTTLLRRLDDAAQAA
jgi:ubiquinone/menaquinone biosynthesis C-methylase UbiE